MVVVAPHLPEVQETHLAHPQVKVTMAVHPLALAHQITEAAVAEVHLLLEELELQPLAVTVVQAPPRL